MEEYSDFDQSRRYATSHVSNIYNETYFCASSISHRKGEEFCLGWCAFQLKFCKSSCMTFNRLTDTSILGIKLHIPHDTPTLLRDPNQSHPFILTIDFITDNLSPLQRSMTFKHLLRSRCIRVDRPVIHGCFSDKTNGFFINPFPECDIFIHEVGFEFCL